MKKFKFTFPLILALCISLNLLSKRVNLRLTNKTNDPIQLIITDGMNKKLTFQLDGQSKPLRNFQIQPISCSEAGWFADPVCIKNITGSINKDGKTQKVLIRGPIIEDLNSRINYIKDKGTLHLNIDHRAVVSEIYFTTPSDDNE